MAEVIEIENIVTRDCRRVIHLMSNRELTVEDLAAFAPQPHPLPHPPFGHPPQMSTFGEGKVEIVQEAGVWHLRAEWPFRGALHLHAEGWPQVKTMVAWPFAGCVNMIEAFMQASVYFEDAFRQKPRFGFVRKLPSGVEHGREVGPLMVFEADWALDKAVVVGG